MFHRPVQMMKFAVGIGDMKLRPKAVGYCGVVD